MASSWDSWTLSIERGHKLFFKLLNYFSASESDDLQMKELSDQLEAEQYFAVRILLIQILIA